MEVLLLIPIGFVGSVFWVVSAEATAIAYGANGYNPLWVGLCAALGQCLMYVVLYHGGERLVGKWAWLAEKVEVLYHRYQDRLAKGYLTATGIASIVGLPPLAALMTLASAFDVRFWRIWPVALVGRIVRFTVLAAVGTELLAWWNGP